MSNNDIGIPLDRTPEINRIDVNVLRTVVPRLWRNGDTDPQLALEVIDGPYKGVIFTFVNFQVLPHDLGNGFVPAKFELKIFRTCPDFVEDEAWDYYAREVLLAWLKYIHMTDLSTVVRAKPLGGVQ